MRAAFIASALLSVSVCEFSGGAEPTVRFSGERKRNNLVSELLEVSSISKGSHSFTFRRPREGWIFISAMSQGKGKTRIILDKESRDNAVISHDADGGKLAETVRYVAKG